MPLSGSSGPPHPTRARAPQRDAGWAYKFKNLTMRMSLKLKINLIREYLELIIHPIKPSVGLFILIKYRETIHLASRTSAFPY
jgi:hypothetical protein